MCVKQQLLRFLSCAQCAPSALPRWRGRRRRCRAGSGMRPCSCGRWASDTTRRAGKPLYDKPPSCCGGRGDRDGDGGDGDGGGGLGDDGGGGGDSTRREVARGSTGSLGGNLPPHLWALLSGGRPRGQLALYKVAPRRDSVKLRPILDCSSWEDSPEQSTTLTPLAAATRSCRCRVCAAAAR